MTSVGEIFCSHFQVAAFNHYIVSVESIVVIRIGIRSEEETSFYNDCEQNRGFVDVN
jgi:hypothetical protein